MNVSETRELWMAEAMHERVLVSAQLIMAALAERDPSNDPAEAAELAVKWALALEARMLMLPKDTTLLRVVRRIQGYPPSEPT